MTITANGTVQWFVYIFGGSTVYEFTLSLNDQSNPNLAQDRNDFWKVITYYAQHLHLKNFLVQRHCRIAKRQHYRKDRNTTCRPTQKLNMSVANFIQDGKTKYFFLNYNDDLLQCTPSISKLLENIKVSAGKLPQ